LWIRLAVFGLIEVAILCDTASLCAQPTRSAGSPSVSLLLDEAIAHKERAEHEKADAKIERAYRLSQTLTDDDPRRVRAEVAFAGLEVAKLLAAEKTDAAHKQAAAAVERAESQKRGQALLAAEDYFRIQAQLNLAGVELQRRNLQQTLAICRQISALRGAAQVAKSQQAEAIILQAGVGILQKNWTAAEAVDLIAQLQSMLPADDPRLYQAQVWTFMTHAWSVAGPGQDRESAAQVDEALEALAGRVESLAEQLASKGVHPALASLGYLGLANAEYESRRLDRVPKSLGRLKIHDDPTRVAPLFRFTFHNLSGLLHAEFNRFSAAGNHFGAAVKLSEQVGDPELRAVVSNNIGQFLLRQGDYPNARRYLQTAIKLYEVPQLINHPGRPFAMVNYAKCLEYDDSLGEARDLIEQALEIVKKSSDPTAAERHAQCLCLAAHGINAYSFGELDIARQSFTELRELVVDLYGERHLHTAEALVNLGWVDLEEKKYENARKRFETALAIISDGYDNEHPRAAEIMGYLARALVGM
jgi:tetratricopeptide (TPR) repeat protein